MTSESDTPDPEEGTTAPNPEGAIGENLAYGDMIRPPLYEAAKVRVELSTWVAVSGGLAVVAWVLSFVQAVSLNSDLNDIAGDRRIGASAVQISQLADQSQLELMTYLTGAFALTALFAVLAAVAMIKSRAQ